MDSPCIKQTVCKVLKIFQYGKYLVAYVLNSEWAKISGYTKIVWNCTQNFMVVALRMDKTTVLSILSTMTIKQNFRQK